MTDSVLEQIGVPVNEEGVCVLHQGAGTQIRFVVWGSATGINIITESPATGFTIPASRLLLSGVKTV